MSSRTGGEAVAVSATTGGRPRPADEVAERQVVGAEVVAPGRDAVRLVDRDQAGLERLDLREPVRVGSAAPGVMNRNSARPSRSASRAASCCLGVSAELTRTARRPCVVALVQPGDLVLLQREQRRDRPPSGPAAARPAPGRSPTCRRRWAGRRGRRGRRSNDAHRGELAGPQRAPAEQGAGGAAQARRVKGQLHGGAAIPDASGHETQRTILGSTELAYSSKRPW